MTGIDGKRALRGTRAVQRHFSHGPIGRRFEESVPTFVYCWHGVLYFQRVPCFRVSIATENLQTRQPANHSDFLNHDKPTPPRPLMLITEEHLNFNHLISPYYPALSSVHPALSGARHRKLANHSPTGH